MSPTLVVGVVRRAVRPSGDWSGPRSPVLASLPPAGPLLSPSPYAHQPSHPITLPPNSTRLAISPADVGGMWKSMAVAASIAAVAGIWILVLMVLSAL